MSLVTTNNIVALRCPACGKTELNQLSLFAFSGSSTWKVKCTCGASLLSLGTKDRKKFWLQASCMVCESQHIYCFTRQEMFGPEVLTLDCEETGVDIGYVGPKKQIKECLREQERSLLEMAADLGFGDYFDNPEVMCSILECLYRVTENGKVQCQCGNDKIEIEIFPEHLELRCDVCGSEGILGALTPFDLEAMNQVESMELTTSGLKMVTGKSRRRKGNTKKS
jgi:hypothetical protein